MRTKNGLQMQSTCITSGPRSSSVEAKRHHSDISSSVGPGKSRLVSASKGHRHSGRRHNSYKSIPLCGNRLTFLLLLDTFVLWACLTTLLLFLSHPLHSLLYFFRLSLRAFEYTRQPWRSTSLLGSNARSLHQGA